VDRSVGQADAGGVGERWGGGAWRVEWVASAAARGAAGGAGVTVVVAGGAGERVSGGSEEEGT
jgi:hypothetical protein